MAGNALKADSWSVTDNNPLDALPNGNLLDQKSKVGNAIDVPVLRASQ